MQDDSDFFEIFPWDKNFNTNIKEIDEQHKKLVAILNTLAAHIANRSSQVSLNEVFEELASYANYHFETEENIWKKHLPVSDQWFFQHEKMHSDFFKQVIALKNKEQQHSLDDTIVELVRFLTHWLAYHILDSDKRMAKMVLFIKYGCATEDAKLMADEEMSGSMQLLIETVLKMYDSMSARTMDLMRERALRKQAEKALLESEERWKFILEEGELNECVWDWDIEQDFITQSKTQYLPLDIIKGNSSTSKDETINIYSKDMEALKRNFNDHLNGKSDFFHSKYRVLKEDGSYEWFLTRGKIVNFSSAGIPLRMIGTNTNITKRELADLIYHHSSQGILVTDNSNVIIGCNPAFTEITGYSEPDIVGQTPSILASDKHGIEFFEYMWDELRTKHFWTGEIWNKKKNGDVFPASVKINVIIGEDYKIEHYIALYSDITERVKQDELIAKYANFDSLTKLTNRRSFQERLDQEIKRANRNNSIFALLFLDLDNFKEINDTLGHEIGDKLLVEAAKRISENIRGTDLVSRFGGDEFTIILTDLHEDSPAVEQTADKIISILSREYNIDSHKLFLSASIGITIFPNDAATAIDLIKNADQAMYRAKKDGRNRYSYFTQSMQETAIKRQILINALRNSIKNNQLEIFYQPIINLKTGGVEKVEALLRWNHPKLGFISPDIFIPLAEETGMIAEIGDWVFINANKQGYYWCEKYNLDLSISVNVSPAQLKNQKLRNNWMHHISKTGSNKNNCIIEITEGMLMEEKTATLDLLLKFRDAKIEIALDDFGTGYSSLSYLNRLDIDYIKIDKTFIKYLSQKSDELALCDAMILMAHKLGIKVIAEGVETEEQQNILCQINCDYAQGFFYSTPLPADSFEKNIIHKSYSMLNCSSLNLA